MAEYKFSRAQLVQRLRYALAEQRGVFKVADEEHDIVKMQGAAVASSVLVRLVEDAEREVIVTPQVLTT